MSFHVPTGEGGIPHPEEFMLRLVNLPEHQHLVEAEPRIEWLMRGHAEVKGGRIILGTVFKPDVTGRLREVFQWLLEEKFGASEDDPIHFLIVLDAEYWADASDLQREILVYHELLHIQPVLDAFGAPKFEKETGRMILGLVGHDVEEFSAVVRRYGAHSKDLELFGEALAEGNARRG